MKKIIYIIFGIFLLVACDDNKVMFDSKSMIYFPEKDYTFTWVKTKDVETTYNVDCKIVGQAPNTDAKIKVVVDASSTAVEGIHYKKLEEFYILKQGKFETVIPIVIYNKDVQLTNKEVMLSLRLEASDDLGVNYDGNMKYDLTLTNQVVKPLYWEQYKLSAFFGVYSKKKHTLIVQLSGKDLPEDSKEYKAQMIFWQNFGNTILKDYFIQNPGIKDENGFVIEPW